MAYLVKRFEGDLEMVENDLQAWFNISPTVEVVTTSLNKNHQGPEVHRYALLVIYKLLEIL